MNRWFISDLHLSEKRPHITAAFFDFLDDTKTVCDELYILGDFFDAWIGDDDDRLLAADIAEALKKVADTGVRIFFQHGNRDFLLSQGYARLCGMTLLPELHVIEQAGQRFLLAHGDQFCTQDVAYQQFRKLVRTPAWQQDLLAKPLDERRAIAAQLRANSKEANSIKAEDIMDVTPSDIENVLLAHQCSTLIHGHTHRPARHLLTLPNGSVAERIVLGDWEDTGWFARLERSELRLMERNVR